MSVHLDKARKTYYVMWRETCDGNIIQKKKRGFATKKEARAFEEDLQNVKDSCSFAQLKDRYFESLKGYASDETIASRKRIAEQYCKSLMPMNVRNIKNQDMMEYKNYVYSLDRSLSHKNRIIQIVKAISKFGYEYYEFPNFGKVLKSFPKTSDDVKEMKIISPDDFEKIRENCSNEVYKRFYTFLYHTGMRRGEAMALQKSDIDGKHADLNKSMRRPNGGFRPLKTVSSKRSIILDDIAYDSIKPLLDTDGDFVFGEYEALSPTTITRIFDKACAKAGLAHYRIHDLRHSFISNAILNGIDIVTVSRYVGHSDIEMTLNKYSHLLKDSEQRMVDKLNELYSKKEEESKEKPKKKRKKKSENVAKMLPEH